MLAHLGYSISTAINGREGIECYRARPFDLVIADVFMPMKDGLQVIREIIDEFPDARFIAMSGAGSYGDSLLEARRLGAQYTFLKPFNTEDLLQVIQREVGRPYPSKLAARSVVRVTIRSSTVG